MHTIKKEENVSIRFGVYSANMQRNQSLVTHRKICWNISIIISLFIIYKNRSYHYINFEFRIDPCLSDHEYDLNII